MREYELRGLRAIHLYEEQGVACMRISVDSSAVIGLLKEGIGDYRLRFSRGSLRFDGEVRIFTIRHNSYCGEVDLTEEKEAYTNLFRLEL